MFNYDKFKDARPEDTVNRIKTLLADIGLNPHVEWVESEYEEALSNRITLFPTSLGTNGKGTSKAYTLASGFAELIERMENGLLMIGYNSPRLLKSFGFAYSPDEVTVSAEALAEQDDPFMKFLFDHCKVHTSEEKVEFLKNFPRPKEDYLCVPYADPMGKRIVSIPIEIMFQMYGSNGMAAGNTMEEALVQALSEILERYTNKAVLKGVVPPEIPRAYWEKTQISELIREIEKSGRYRVSIRDCSLGKQIPATAIVISDLERGKFGIHFSCHPSLEVSIERALTEALQGKNLESFTSYNTIGDDRACYCVDNYPNLMKVGFGAYPIGFFADEPSYQFVPNNTWQGLNNREMLQKLLKIIYNEGYEVLVRDASHLGFPAYHVIVPGMSEMFFKDDKRFKELRTANHVLSSMAHFPELTPEEEKRLLLLIRYKEFSVLENGFDWITTLPLIGNKLKIERVRAYLHYKRGEYSDARTWFQRAAENVEDAGERKYLLCCAEFVRLLMIDADMDKVRRAISQYFPAGIVEDVYEKMREPSLIMKKVFMPFPCDKCDTCPHAGVNCGYPEIEKVMLKIKGALAKSTVDQKTVLDQLAALIN